MNVPLLTVFTASMTSARDGSVLSYGKPLQIALIAYLALL
jgi:hypothetical protein